MTQNPMSGPSQPRKRIWWFGGLLAALAVSITLLASQRVLIAYKLSQHLAALKSQHLPTNAVELNEYYTVPQGVSDTTDTWMAAIDALASAPIDPRSTDIPFLAKGPVPIPAPGEVWYQFEPSRQLLLKLDGQLYLIRQAAASGGACRYPIDFTAGVTYRTDEVQGTRSVEGLLSLCSHVHAHERMPSKVLDDLNAAFAVSDSLRAAPSIIPFLLRIAIHSRGCKLAGDLLKCSDWNDQQLASLQDAIGKAEFRPELSRVFAGERALCLDVIGPSRDGFFINDNKLKALEIFGSLVDGVDSSWPQAIDSSLRMQMHLHEIHRGNLITSFKYRFVLILIPPLAYSATAAAKAEARQNCLIATIAAHRYRLHHSELPKSPTDLIDWIPGDETTKNQRLTDPFNGRPLRLLSVDGSLLIYSIGEDRKDDGGNIVYTPKKGRDPDIGHSISK